MNSKSKKHLRAAAARNQPKDRRSTCSWRTQPISLSLKSSMPLLHADDVSRWGREPHVATLPTKAAGEVEVPNPVAAFICLLQGFPMESDPSKLVRCIEIKIDIFLSKNYRDLALLTFNFVFLFSVCWLAAIFSYLCDFNFVLQLENDLDSYDLFE